MITIVTYVNVKNFKVHFNLIRITSFFWGNEYFTAFLSKCNRLNKDT